MAKRRAGLRGTDNDHVEGARRELDSAWTDLENLPPTCEGGIQRAARALGGFARASVHLDQIADRATREANTDLYGLRNIGDKAAWDATRFYSQVCKAPHREAADRPLTSRAKALEILRPKPKKRRAR
jgi:hypothetical protein